MAKKPTRNPAPPPTNDGDSPPTPAPSGSPKAVVKKTLDLSVYRKGGDAAPAAPTAKGGAPARELRTTVKFSDLAGIEGLHAKDAWEGDSDEFGPFLGVTVVLPDGAEAIARSGATSGPGKAVQRALDRGLFDDPTDLVPMRVRTQPSTVNVDPVTGKPFTRVLVRFG